ncbi:D-aminoacyl-tRNA deacylase [Corynebacterium sp. ES2794-CONJ1]|uniref:D-aminoacyl-tRNA deacylase n=1 Tax=unclassified Corynebacterium TaxID=2624378 RepID=UPI002169E614|nr:MULTISPECIES: D-aminoacyl-tRNA deacylase [unclassified Corynebacterium]MCS4489189.1 D-aminoacyl-tRNA deacylase [Corynebacterium sp. ES2775-CONJ]MCS4491002.1 D-aminoacyl-tRNA deacylase [Corynebacterium sp. ES2715-CONJ3]MCS4531117.1 D-aminoacyl-tRNA deacylase [Corynebacterium sp. ES2730-CONJ]MCU9518484.1 D-aminoacyl-tRNA deacylase [Corynebacterium sp. ES2794-CONJ1]
MRAVLMRVSEAQVRVDGHIVGQISCPEYGGILALIGVAATDDESDVDTMVRKIAELRILKGERSISDLAAPVLLVSQFTLLGRTAKGRRPSWSDAAHAEQARALFNAVVSKLANRGISCEQGVFGADMQVESVNEGPYTVLVDTRATL